MVEATTALQPIRSHSWGQPNNLARLCRNQFLGKGILHGELIEVSLSHGIFSLACVVELLGAILVPFWEIVDYFCVNQHHILQRLLWQLQLWS